MLPDMTWDELLDFFHAATNRPCSWSIELATRLDPATEGPTVTGGGVLADVVRHGEYEITLRLDNGTTIWMERDQVMEAWLTENEASVEVFLSGHAASCQLSLMYE